jgi:aspartyl-tRNA(Asn)/glutamyl-tRNA(Gln) amidotransferase subunit A
MTTLSLVETRVALQRGETSSLKLVETALQNAAIQAELNAFAYLATEEALANARQADLTPSQGVLHGIPVSVKDLFKVNQMPTKAGTNSALPDLGTATQARAVQHLVDAGAIIIGKTNMHEIALGITGENTWTGDVKNPIDPTRQAGGSSSGSAAAVGASIGLASLGSDTGGSVRIPASFCGIVGFKPSFGLIPLEGALPLSTTCDHAGVMTKNVQDAHLMLEVLAHRNYFLRHLDNLTNLRLGVPRVWLEGRLSTSVRKDFENLLLQLKEAGAEVLDVQPENLALASQCYTPIVRAEAAFIHRLAMQSNPSGFSPSVLPALEDGAKITAGAYLEARAERRLVRTGLETTLQQVDALVLPTAPLGAPIRGTNEVLLESGMRSHRNAFIELTLPFSLVGLPTLSVPFTKESKMPVGLQIVAARGEDALALELGWWLEQNL